MRNRLALVGCCWGGPPRQFWPHRSSAPENFPKWAERRRGMQNPAFPGWYRILRCDGPDYGLRYNILCEIERGSHGGPGG
jgi:hypothetical protein